MVLSRARAGENVEISTEKKKRKTGMSVEEVVWSEKRGRKRRGRGGRRGRKRKTKDKINEMVEEVPWMVSIFLCEQRR